MSNPAFHIPAVFQTMRPPFLVLTPIVVLLGASSSATHADGWVFDLLLIVIAALLAHISVNMLNEYQDYHSGIDLNTQRTPFSGGSGALPEHPQSATAVLWGGIASLGLMGLIGLYFIQQAGWLVLAYGVIGSLIIVLYTRVINRSPVLCLIAPGAGFGLLMVSGTQLVLQQQITEPGIYSALIVFFLVNNLLLLNQFPDIEADKNAGRFHALIAWGPKKAAQWYGMFLMAAAITLIIAIIQGAFPLWSAVALLPMIPGVLAWRGACSLGENIAQEPKLLAMNVVMNLATPALLAGTLSLQ